MTMLQSVLLPKKQNCEATIYSDRNVERLVKALAMSAVPYLGESTMKQDAHLLPANRKPFQEIGATDAAGPGHIRGKSWEEKQKAQ